MSSKNQDFRNKKFNNQKPQKATVKPQPRTATAAQQKKKREKSGFTISPKLERLLPWIYFLLFAVVAFVYLAVLNKEYLYACQEHSIWQNNEEFFADRMRVVGGLSQWIGCYLTQYFYHPWAGTLILIALWGLIYALTVSVFDISRRWCFVALAPVVLLLCSEINLGYWMYYIKLPGYWFTYTVAILLMLLGLYICKLYKGYVRAILIPLYVVGLYPLIGFWSLCGAGYMALRELVALTEGGKLGSKSVSRLLAVALAIAAVIIVPRIYYQHYTAGRVEDIYTAMLPLFQNDKYIESVKRTLFIIIALIPVVYIIPETRKWMLNAATSPMFCMLSAVVTLVFYVWLINFNHFSDRNFQAELKMYRLLGDCDWEGALEASKEAEGPHTRQMIMGQNIALFHLGNIGNTMFKYENRTVQPTVWTYKKSAEKKKIDDEKYKDQDPKNILGNLERDSIHVNLCNTCGPLYYFYYGKTNFATRWCIENGVEYGFRVDDYKNLICCAMMAGEDKVAAKYIDILRSTTFHKDWADARLAMLRDRKAYEQTEEYKCVKPMYDSFKNALDGDQGLVEVFLISYFCHMTSDNPKFQEACLAFALIQKDIELFWQRFFKYADLHEKDPMPIHYQEAAYLFGDLEKKVDTSHMPFDKTMIVNRYASFKNVTSQLMQQYRGQYKNEAALTRKVGEECLAQFGDTYWWFYYFSRGVHTY